MNQRGLRRLRGQSVQMVQGQVRAVEDRLDARYRMRVGAEHHSVPWLITRASCTLTRYHVFEDVGVGYMNWKGRKSNGERQRVWKACVVFETGEDKFEPRCGEGTWYAMTDRTGEKQAQRCESEGEESAWGRA